MAVLLHCHFGVACHLVLPLGERLEERPLVRMEVLLPAVRPLLHPCLVVGLHHLPDCPVEFLQGEEGAVTEPGIDPPVHKADMVLDKRLLRGLARLARDRHEVVMVAHVLQDAVDFRLIAVRLYDRCLQVVRHQDLRDPSQMLQTHLQGMQEVLSALALHADGITVVRVRHARDEGLDMVDLPRVLIDIIHPVTAEVDIQLLCRPVAACEDRCLGFLRYEVLFQVEEELGTAVSVRMASLVLLPYKLTGHVTVRELLPVERKLGQEDIHPLIRIGRIPRMELRLQFHVRQLQQLVYVIAVHGYLTEIFIDCVLAYAAQRFGYPP